MNMKEAFSEGFNEIHNPEIDIHLNDFWFQVLWQVWESVRAA